MNQLKNLRTKKGVSQQIVADYLEITRQAYSNYENGNRDPDNETLLKLAEYFEVSVDYLLRGKERAPTPEGERKPDIEDVKIALFGGDGEVTDEMWEEALFAAEMIKERYKRKKVQND